MLMWGSIRTIVPQGTSSVTNIRYYRHIRKSLVARSLSSSATTSEETLTLYQYAICPFCNIVKSVLHYGNLPYKAIEVNPLSKSEVQQFSKEYRKVPILTNSTSTALYGSQEIVQELIPLLQPDKQQSLRTNNKDDEAYQEQQQYWVGFAKDDLAPLLYPNLCNTLRNSYKAFGYVHDPTNPNTFSTLQKYSIQWLGSIAMYLAASKIKSEPDAFGVIKTPWKIILVCFSHICRFCLPFSQQKREILRMNAKPCMMPCNFWKSPWQQIRLEGICLRRRRRRTRTNRNDLIWETCRSMAS